MIAPKERRARLFRTGKPKVRFIVEDDMKWIWAAHKVLGGKEDDCDAFYHSKARELGEYDAVWVLEDKNRQFGSGFGPVGVVVANRDDWVMEPHVAWFPWARGYNRLRCSVAFFMQQRWSKEIGVIRIHTDDSGAEFFEGLKRYCPLYRAGRIPGGRPEGMDHLFYVRGKKHVRSSKGTVRKGGEAGANANDSVSPSEKLLNIGDSGAGIGSSDDQRRLH